MTVAEAEDVLLTAEEAMEYLGVRRNTFYRLRKERRVVPVNENPAYLRQPRPLYSKIALQRLLEQLQHDLESSQ